MKIISKVLLGMLLAMLAYPFVHLVSKGLWPEDVHGLGAFLGVIGSVYGVLVAFVIFVVWDQYNAVEKATVREAGLVEDLYRLSRYFSDDPMDFRKKFAKSIKEYLAACVEEWPDLALCRESERTISALNALENRLRDVQTNNRSDAAVYDNLLDTLKKLFECRDERIAVAKHRMPETLINLLILLSTVLLLGFFILPMHSSVLGAFIVTSAAGILLSIFEVVRDIDNPFTGVWNVSPEPFIEQAKKIV